MKKILISLAVVMLVGNANEVNAIKVLENL